MFGNYTLDSLWLDSDYASIALAWRKPCLTLRIINSQPISTWAEVAIILFMVWEKYGPAWGTGHLTPFTTLARGGVWQFVWENRTLWVAILGLGFIGWLYLWRGMNPTAVPQSLPSDTAKLADLTGQVASLKSKLDAKTRELDAADHKKAPPHYTASEIDTMLGTLGKLRDLLGTRQRQPDKDVKRLIINSTRRMGPTIGPPLPLPREAAEVADNIENYASKLAEDNGKINDLLDLAPLLKTELSSTIDGFQEKIRKFTNSIFEMASVLRLAAENIKDNAPIGTFISQQTSNLLTSATEYNEWLADSIQKIEVKPREIRGWK
jgi:hypothetical protein